MLDLWDHRGRREPTIQEMEARVNDWPELEEGGDDFVPARRRVKEG